MICQKTEPHDVFDLAYLDLQEMRLAPTASVRSPGVLYNLQACWCCTRKKHIDF